MTGAFGERVETGACFCGRITAELRGEPFWINYDHDDDCRRAVGSPVMVWVGYQPDQFRVSRGTPRTFSQTRGVVRSFCAECGTSISYVDEGLPDEFYVSIGFLDHPERFQPQAHAYWRMRLPWVRFDDALERLDEYSRDRDARFGKPNER